MREAIGAVLRRERLERGLTLRELSDAARVSLPYLSEIERGRKEPSSEILAAVAPVLALSIADVVVRATTELASAEARVVDLAGVRSSATAAVAPDVQLLAA